MLLFTLPHTHTHTHTHTTAAKLRVSSKKPLKTINHVRVSSTVENRMTVQSVRIVIWYYNPQKGKRKITYLRKFHVECNKNLSVDSEVISGTRQAMYL